MELGAWIRAQRRKLGISQQALGDRAGVAQTTISKWELGKSPLLMIEIDRLEAVFHSRYTDGGKVPDIEISRNVPVMGYVVAGQAVELAREPLEFIELPPGAVAGARCAIVRGGGLPPFKDGAALIWWAWSEDPALYVGELCYVEVEGGDAYVREILRGSRRGLWTLRAATGDLMQDVRIKRCALIEMTWRRPQWKTEPTRIMPPSH